MLYEISNEDTGGLADIAWQFQMIAFIKSYERTKTHQHPVGMTVPWPVGDDTTLLQSPADWISPRAKLPVADGRKVILNDTDHSYFWTGLKTDGLAAQRAWIWKNFILGNQCLFMDPYLDPSHDPGRNNPGGGRSDPYWDIIRRAMADTRRFAERMNLTAMTPQLELASTGYCLANPVVEYLMYQPKSGEVLSVKLKAGSYRYEWFDPVKGETAGTDGIESPGRAQQFKAPFEGDAVLYLKAL